jgi:integrase/recombinase XerD
MSCLSFDKWRKKWRVRWQVCRGCAKIFSGSKSFIEKSQATKFYAKMEELEQSCRAGVKVEGKSLSQARDEFFSYIKKHTPRTQEGYKFVLGKFCEHLLALPMEQITANHIQDYIYNLRDRKLTNRTINNHLIALKAFCRFCEERFAIPNISVKVSLLKEEPSKTRFLTESEYQKILKVATPLAADRFGFIANTGLRASEFHSLTPDCIRDATLTVTGKGRKRRHIPLNQAALNILGRYGDLTRFTVSRSVFYHQARKYAKKAEIPCCGPHAFRHYFATELLKRGVPIKKVSILLGHKSVQTTENTYAHILPADLKGVTDCLL